MMRPHRRVGGVAVFAFAGALAAMPAAHARTTSASTTNPDGTTTTITKNADGTTTRTVTDANGQVVSSGPVQPEPVTKVPPRQPGTSASTTDADGNTVTITKNPDGSTTRTVTRPDGTVVSSAPVEPEPVTQVKPREGGDSASTTDADGNTITVTTNPDGSKVKIVTSPDGRELSRLILDSKPQGPQLLYQTAKTGDATANVGMSLWEDAGRAILDVSVLVTGQGGNFRTWVPQTAVLQFGKDKVKAESAEPYYVEKESALARIAPAVFAAVGASAADAEKAEASEGTACHGSGESGERKDSSFKRHIEHVGKAAGMAGLGTQMKGQLEGRRFRFNVTPRISQLTGNIVLDIANEDPALSTVSNIANTPRRATLKLPFTFDSPGSGSLITMVRPKLVNPVNE